MPWITPNETFLAEHWPLILAAVVTLLILRPLFFGGLALTQSVMIGPNIGMLSLSRPVPLDHGPVGDVL